MKISIRIVFAYMAFLIFVPTANSAGNIYGNYLVDSEFVASKIGDPNWVILDGRSAKEYEAGHIPGAVSYGKPVVGVLKHAVDGAVHSPERIAELLGQIGLSNDKGLIIYGEKGDFHVCVEMAPVFVGVEKFYYLDGGFEDWAEGGREVETAIVEPTKAVFNPEKVNHDLFISTDELINVVNNRHLSDKVTIIDARSKEEYNTDVIQTVRGGRIPGAISIPAVMNVDPKTGKFLPKEKLAELYKDIPEDHKIIAYCHRGCRTAFTSIAMDILGRKNFVVYEAGWNTWGSRVDTPIENEHYRYFRGTDKKISNLEKKVEQLEQQLQR